MGNKNFTRRHFFRKLSAAPATDNNTTGSGDDPLFQKYSRKKLTGRRYSTEEKQLKVGTEDDGATQRTGTPVTSGLAPYTGTWTEWEVLHLLRRTNFGWKKAWVDALLPMTPSAAVDAVLNVNSATSTMPVNWYQNFSADESAIAGNNNATDNPTIGYGADWTNHYFSSTTNAANTSTSANGQVTNSNRMDGLRRWLFGLALNGDYTIREKMVWFWYHFIPVDFKSIYESGFSYTSNNCARILYRYMKLFRNNATGNFKTLMKKVSTEPAMMFYLNTQASTAKAPDENYGRELMELFTLGKEPLRYTEDDVKAAARVFTGWRVNGMNTANVTTDMTQLNTASNRIHDPNAKLFSSFFGNATIASSTTNTAVWAAESDQFLDLIFGSTQAETVSRYICRRLYRYFVYYDIDANVENNIIIPLAQTFVSNNWDIKPVLSQLFKSQHFFDAANRGCYIKSPFDLVAGFANSFSAAINFTDANTEYQYRIWGKLGNDYCVTMEQEMGSIPNVSGWNAFYQTPAYHQYWINSNTVQKRFKFIADHFSLAGTGYTITGVPSRRFLVDTVAFVQQFDSALVANPNTLVDTCIKYLLPVDLTTTVKADIKNRNLLNSLGNDSYWTNTLWGTYISNPTAANRKLVEDKLKALLHEICQYADYQLM